MPLTFLPFAFLLLPVSEIAVFILVGSRIGVVPTILLVIATAIAGATLMRVQGFAAVSRIRADISQNRLPGRELAHGAMIFAAGLLLLTPGFITDTLGLVLFIPPVREAAWRFLSARVSVLATATERGRTGSKGVVDLDPGEFSVREKPGENAPANPGSPWRKPLQP